MNNSADSRVNNRRVKLAEINDRMWAVDILREQLA